MPLFLVNGTITIFSGLTGWVLSHHCCTTCEASRRKALRCCSEIFHLLGQQNHPSIYQPFSTIADSPWPDLSSVSPCGCNFPAMQHGADPMIKMYILSQAIQQLLFNFNIGTVQNSLNIYTSSRCYLHVFHCVLYVCDHCPGQCQWT